MSPILFLVGGNGPRRHEALSYAALLRLFARASDRAGIRTPWEGDKLVIRGPRRADSVARLLIEHKPEVLAALAPDVDSADYRQPVIDPTWRNRYSARIVHWFLWFGDYSGRSARKKRRVRRG
jgi:hypothetical protein